MLVHLIQVKHSLLLFLQLPIEYIVDRVICGLLFRVVVLLRRCCRGRIGWTHHIRDHHWLRGLGWLRQLLFYFAQGWRGTADFQIGLVASVLAKARRVRHGAFRTVLEGNLEILVSRSSCSTVDSSIFIVLNEYVINY
jgi:hypothetical protein